MIEDKEYNAPMNGRKRIPSEREEIQASKKQFRGPSPVKFSPTRKGRTGSIANQRSPLSSMAGMVRSKPAKALGIKSLSVATSLNDDYHGRSWSDLESALSAIFNRKPVSVSQEQLFSHVKNMCNHKLATKLYDVLMKAIRDQTKREVGCFQSLAGEKELFLSKVRDVWQLYCQQIIFIRSIFLSLDTFYVTQVVNIAPIWDAALEMFRDNVSSTSNVRHRLRRDLQSLVEQERSGESTDRSLLSSLVHMTMDLKTYADDFEELFLNATDCLYEEEGRRLLVTESMAIPEYLLHVDQRLKQEQERVTAYLHPSTKAPLIVAVDGNLIGKHVQLILSRGLDELLDAKRCRELHLLCALFRRTKGASEQLCKALGDYAKRRGTAIVMNTDRDSSMVQDLLDFKETLDVIICDSFGSDEKFVATLKEAFATVINRRSNKPAEFIAKFVDLKLRAGNKETTEEELDQLLDRVMVLFRFIQGKDFFEAFYQSCLAKRLLVGKSASVDSERSMLSKLKQECGPGYTNKMEGMFKDMELSREISANFKAVSSRLESDIDLSVNVLTRGHWPSFPSSEVTLMPEMARLQTAFREFYVTKRAGTKLTWQNTLGHCVLKAAFNHGKKELQVSLYQTIVLCMFNDGDSFSFDRIQSTTSIEKVELKRILQSLACGKARVLTKEPKGKDIGETDVFHFNGEFSHKLFRIKINQIQMKETQEENSNTAERVIQDRQYQIDAAIVRIMKMRKRLSHQDLLQECFGQLKFPVKAIDLKKRIESLIERGYLARNEDNQQEYIYQA